MTLVDEATRAALRPCPVCEDTGAINLLNPRSSRRCPFADEPWHVAVPAPAETPPLVGPHASREPGPKATEEARVRGHARSPTTICDECALSLRYGDTHTEEDCLRERLAQTGEERDMAIRERDALARHGTALRGEILSACGADGETADPLVEVRRRITYLMGSRDAAVERVAFLDKSIRHVQDREDALHAQVKRQSSTIDNLKSEQYRLIAERDRALADVARHASGHPTEAPAPITEDCPIGHHGATRVPEQETGSVERCLHCEACPADYVRVNGRWFDASSPRVRPPLSCGDCGQVAYDIEEHHIHTCPPGTKKGPL